MEEGIPYPGNCGGTSTLTLEYTEGTDDFTGNLFLDGFCDNNVLYNGTLVFSGTGYFPYDITEFSISFNTLEITFDVGGTNNLFTFEGDARSSMVFDPDFSNTITMDLLTYEDVEAGKTHKFEDYQAVITNPLGEDAVLYTVTGKYTNPDHGFVNIFDTFIHEKYFEADPFLGEVLKIMGLHSSRAKLVWVSMFEYRIEIDLDGDGTYELVLPVCPWTNFG